MMSTASVGPAAGRYTSPNRRLAAAFALTMAFLISSCQRVPEGAIGPRDVDYAMEVLQRAPEHGFAPEQFQEDRLTRLSASDKPADRAARDRLLRAELVAYAKAQHGLSIPRKSFSPAWGLRPAAYDAEAELTAAVKERRFREWLDAQPPTSPTYQTLQKAYLSYLKLAAAGGWPTVPGGAVLRIGAQGPAVQALRQRLAAEDAALAETPLATPFDQELANAVGRFQTALGLPATGVVDTQTLRELNVPTSARATQIRANLERLRWLPRDEPPTRVEVNTAAATFAYYADGKPVMTMLAASGKPGDETPMLTSTIENIVLNPPWNVPDGIAQEELYPKEASNPGYFAANNYVVENGRLIQKPGPESALGLVKFDFDNPYAVYLHDTPSKAAFLRAQRAVSHGCVRLQHAVAFAKVLLSNQPGWSAAKVDEVLASGETTHVKLGRKVPVRLMYLTAFPDRGRIAFRPDVYGWDQQLVTLLNRPGGAVMASADAKRLKKG
jgi:murein L,D-transpeptidase YcbB/YkuD